MNSHSEDTVKFRKTISLEDEKEHAYSLLVKGHQLSGELTNLLTRSNVHNDAQEAIKLGFTAPIVSADYLYCLICNYLYAYFGNVFNNRGIVETIFLKPIFVGEEFTCIFKTRKENKQIISVDYCFKNEQEEVLLSGNAKIDSAG